MNSKVNVTDYGYKEYEVAYIEKCPQCGEEYARYVGELEYNYNNKMFCSWNCKCKYRKTHPLDVTERETKTLTYAAKPEIKIRKAATNKNKSKEDIIKEIACLTCLSRVQYNKLCKTKKEDLIKILNELRKDC